MNYNQSPWKNVAWNGISFMTPATWQVGSMANNYLMLEEDGEPVVEVKWGQVKGGFSHEAHLRRLSSLHRKGFVKTVSKCPIPEKWNEVLGNYKATAFSWKGKSISGQGIILFCPLCHNATLIQFYRISPAQLNEFSQRLLSTFKDHREDKQVLWSLFGIRAKVPEAFRLQKYRFEPGGFELIFASKEQRIVLQRWAPATVLLRNQNFSQLIKSMIGNYKGEVITEIVTQDKVTEWTCAPFLNQWASRWLFLKKKAPYQRHRLWHLEEQNCLLSVTIEGRSPPDRARPAVRTARRHRPRRTSAARRRERRRPGRRRSTPQPSPR